MIHVNIHNRLLLVDNSQSDDRLERETRVTSNNFLLSHLYVYLYSIDVLIVLNLTQSDNYIRNKKLFLN